jgi:hypothetical protein
MSGAMKVLKVALVLVVSHLAIAQTPSLPSTEEISELTDKASEKISAFGMAVKSAKPDLDRVDPTLAPKYLEAADAAQTTIKAIRKNGATGYNLVALLGTLDDLSLEAATGALRILVAYTANRLEGGQSETALHSVMLLNTAQSGCYDISELLLHATLRFIAVEDKTVGVALSKR